MSWVSRYYRTTQGKKVVMAVTGLILFAYVLFHMLGNLQIYYSAEQLNAYATFLHSSTFFPFLWGARIVLTVAFVLHVLAAVQLVMQNWGSRPVQYVKQRFQEADYAARTMVWSGPIVLFFLVYHVLQLTTATIQPAPYDAHNVYNNVVGGFQVPFVSTLYILSMVLLGMHFYHGLWSWFQTLGLAHPKYNGTRRLLATALTLVIVIGNISIPVSVLTGLLPLQ